MAGGAAVLQNPESGVACIAGMATFLFFRHLPTGAPASDHEAAGDGRMLRRRHGRQPVAFAAAARGLLGPLPSPAESRDYLRLMKAVTRSGYGGGTGPLDPMAVLILGQAAPRSSMPG